MKPLRVLIITPWGERLGGAEEMLWLALSTFDRKRLDASVAFLGPGPFEREVSELGIATEVIETGRLRQTGAAIGSVRRLAGLLRERDPDLVLSWSAKAHLYAASAATLARRGDRLVWWQHTTPDGHWMDRVATVLPARAIGCSSEAGRRRQAELRPRRRSFVVNPGIEVGPEPGGGEASLRESLGIADGRLVVGIVGRLQPNKGQDRFLRALAELHDRGHDLHGLVVGGDAHELSPEYLPRLEGLIGELGLAEAVTLTGQVDDARPYLELIDIAVNASEQESFPLVLMEAMAAGAAVVAVGRDGRLDIVEPGVTGVLTESGEPSDLAAGIEQLIANAGLRATIVRRARQHCVERFTAARMSDLLCERLAEVACA